MDKKDIFKTITQKFGQAFLSKTVEGGSCVYGGDWDRLDINSAVRTAAMIKSLGQRFQDGLMESYDISCCLNSETIDTSYQDEIYLYRHEWGINNPFKKYISADETLAAKYSVRLDNMSALGRYPFDDGRYSQVDCSVRMTKSIWNDGTQETGYITMGNSTLARYSGDYSNTDLGQALQSDIYLHIFSEYFSDPNEDRLRQFDILYTLHFKRVIE